MTTTIPLPRISAMLYQPLNGGTYSVCYRTASGEKQVVVSARQFWAIMERLGNPAAVEPGYWTF